VVVEVVVIETLVWVVQVVVLLLQLLDMLVVEVGTKETIQLSNLKISSKV
jgi:hypothetical protein